MNPEVPDLRAYGLWSSGYTVILGVIFNCSFSLEVSELLQSSSFMPQAAPCNNTLRSILRFGLLLASSPWPNGGGHIRSGIDISKLSLRFLFPFSFRLLSWAWVGKAGQAGLTQTSSLCILTACSQQRQSLTADQMPRGPSLQDLA